MSEHTPAMRAAKRIITLIADRVLASNVGEKFILNPEELAVIIEEETGEALAGIAQPEAVKEVVEAAEAICRVTDAQESDADAQGYTRLEVPRGLIGALRSALAKLDGEWCCLITTCCILRQCDAMKI